MIRLILMCLLVLNVLGTGTATAATTVQQDAVRIATADPEVQDRLRLRPGLTAQATPLESRPGYAEVAFSKDGTVVLRTVVNLRTARVEQSSGQTLMVMPGVRTVLLDVITSPWMQLPLLALFGLCLAGPIGSSHRRPLLPVFGIATVSVLMLLDLVPSTWVRAGNVLLFGASTLLLVIGSVLWIRHARRPPEAPVCIRGSAWLWTAVAVGGLIMQLGWGLAIRVPIDVAYASDAGARLMQGGARVYGNTLDLPGFLMLADTYAPLAYLSYVPGVAAFDDPRNAILVTNVTLALLGAVALYLLGSRIRDRTTGAWMAAAWSTCPFVATGVSAGNNDVIVGTLVAGAMLAMRRPAWRAIAIAAAGAVKYLPLAAALAMLRQRDEAGSAAARALGAGLLTLLVLLIIGVHDLDGMRVYLDRAFGYQLDRDDIASVWGLTGLGDARYVLLAAAGLLGLAAPRLVRRGSMAMVPACTAATMALALAALPQFWPAYVTWIVPAVLALCVSAGDVSAERRAGARPSSTDP